MEYERDAVRMTVQDDGRGLPEGKDLWRKGRGLSNIRWRGELLRGKLELKSQLNRGTTLRIIIPF